MQQSQQKSEMQRRDFLGASGAAGAGLAFGAFTSVASAARRSPNETLRIGIVGPGGRGSALMRDLFGQDDKYNARLTAVCDIWSYRRATSKEMVTNEYGSAPKVYKNYDQLLNDKDIDAIIIATADHQHGKMLVECVNAGKDAYCEKPMANTLDDANRALDAVKRTGRVVQLGTQRRSFAKYRSAAQVMKEGVIGEVSKVEVAWTEYSPYRWRRNKEELQACKEADTDWSTWLMDKPHRPFDPRIYRSFRLFKDFSSGIFDQWMTHAIDAVHFLTGTEYPLNAVAHGGIYHWNDYRENPDTCEALFEYGKGNKKFLVTYATNLVNAQPGWWVKVMGTHGTLECESGDYAQGVFRVSGDGSRRRDALKDSTMIEEDPQAMHHMANWLDAVRRQDPSAVYAPASAGYGHSIACIMATDALWSAGSNDTCCGLRLAQSRPVSRHRRLIEGDVGQ